MGLLSKLFDKFSNKKDQIAKLLNSGAIIIDVRSPQEFSSGHVKGSKNIPLNILSEEVDKLKKMNKPFIMCCASGIRSAKASNILKKEGLTVINGGGWRALA